jgi:CRISPR-associated protein Cas1
MPSNVSITGDDALTLDMVNQYVYCPRRFHLMYVEGRWQDNQYTVEGRHVHRRVDQVDHLLPHADAGASQEKARKDADAGDGDEPPVVTRSVPLASEALGITAKLDLVSSDGSEAVPVETKRGRVPQNELRSYDTHRVQLMVQGMLLRECGYQCDHGILYFAGSRTRVDVPFNPELEAQSRQFISETHAATKRQEIPLPLEDSPKCAGCSLAGICLPDETLAMMHATKEYMPLPAKPREGAEETSVAIRRLYPARPDALPLYVQEQGAYIGKTSGSLVVKLEGKEVARVGTKDISQLVLCGNVQVSTQTLHMLCESEIPVVHRSSGMWFYGITSGISLRNSYDRAAQFRAAGNAKTCLDFAKSVVSDKGQNQRTIIRRNAPASATLDSALADMDDLLAAIPAITSIDSLLGIEGNLAARYFSQFGQMLGSGDLDSNWDFSARNRRPPRDPVNALLSFTYALLAKDCTTALLSEGLDPWWGLYHRPRHGRPALALDLMEPLRPVVADSAVITAINTGMVQRRHFEMAHSGCAMNAAGRKGILRAYEARMDQLITHPVFGYRCSWRAVLFLQARLLSRYLRGDVPEFRNVVTR